MLYLEKLRLTNTSIAVNMLRSSFLSFLLLLDTISRFAHKQQKYWEKVLCITTGEIKSSLEKYILTEKNPIRLTNKNIQHRQKFSKVHCFGVCKYTPATQEHQKRSEGKEKCIL